MGGVSGGGAHPIRRKGTDLIVIADAETAGGCKGDLEVARVTRVGLGDLKRVSHPSDLSGVWLIVEGGAQLRVGCGKVGGLWAGVDGVR